MRRRLLHGHPFLSGWSARRTFAASVFGMLVLLGVVNLDPRMRAGIRYARPPAQYLVPVTGIAPRQVRSSWGTPRSGGRAHEGVDILAPRGRTVVSAADGVVWTAGRNSLGGNTVWVLGEGWNLYYYAHLDAWAPGIAPGVRLRAGDAIGSVGTTGNARGGPSHLHFGLTKLGLFGPHAIDPAPLLRAGRSVPAAVLVGGVTEPAAGRPGGREDLVMPTR